MIVAKKKSNIFLILVLFSAIAFYGYFISQNKGSKKIDTNETTQSSDVSNIEKKHFRYFKNLKYLVIDCLWYRYHPSHLNLEKVLELTKIFKPKKTILTNLHSDLDYKELLNRLPKKIVPAYDGMTLNL